MARQFEVGDVVSITPQARDEEFWNGGNLPPHCGAVLETDHHGLILVQFDAWTGGGYQPDAWWFRPFQLVRQSGQQLDLFDWTPPEPPAPVPQLKDTSVQLHPSDKIILKHLKARKTISPMEALASYGCARLAPRIHNLRKAGHAITTKLNRDEPGHVYARYTLEHEGTK